MGCGASDPNTKNPKSLPSDPMKEEKNLQTDPKNALNLLHNYDLWVKTFDYLNIKELAKISQVCRYFRY